MKAAAERGQESRHQGPAKNTFRIAPDPGPPCQIPSRPDCRKFPEGLSCTVAGQETYLTDGNTERGGQSRHQGPADSAVKAAPGPGPQ